MENLKQLQQFVRGTGWYSGTLKLTIELKCKFEGFYGKASETWESQVLIELSSPDEKMFPNVKVLGKRYESIDDVAKIVMQQIGDWQYRQLQQQTTK